MTDSNDYSKHTIEELYIEENKRKKNDTLNRFLMGFLAGVMIYGVINNGIGFLHVFLPAILILGIYKQSKKNIKELTLIQAQLEGKSHI